VQLAQHLDDATVTDYCNKFLGFGRGKAPVWFVGIEEAGGWTVEDVQNRLRAWHEHGRKRLEDAPRFYPASGITTWHELHAQFQPTWKKLIRMLLLAKGKLDTDEAIFDYQRNHLGAADGEACIVELLPLPSPTTGDWNYAEWSSLPWLRSRNHYVQAIRAGRENELRLQISEHEPKAVIFYGLELPGRLSLLPGWSSIAGGRFDQAIRDEQILLWRRNVNTSFFVTRHPSAESNEYFCKIGRFLRENHGNSF